MDLILSNIQHIRKIEDDQSNGDSNFLYDEITLQCIKTRRLGNIVDKNVCEFYHCLLPLSKSR